MLFIVFNKVILLLDAYVSCLSPDRVNLCESPVMPLGWRSRVNLALVVYLTFFSLRITT